ncbi:MAG TPA: tRNA (adenosine(37)-N6)-threonylcarbamoyltransferase complex dimerization subunit type 1 TsaB [Candidatus Saccharimonadia bacterium]|nr:tRNA (adenosine(37)-N6)-threonylcarbamoyltransferase complex dimerization subunit type 1 TsaB [Candidatus Saccharimonadia bacterium]
MLFLTIRTDKPQAELAIYNNQKQLYVLSYLADRQLAETIHSQILKLLKKLKYDLSDLDGIVIYKGPGSFTGLRIGFSVANAFAYAFDIKIIAESGNDWQGLGIKKLISKKGAQQVFPKYGSKVHITKPKK